MRIRTWKYRCVCVCVCVCVCDTYIATHHMNLVWLTLSRKPFTSVALDCVNVSVPDVHGLLTLRDCVRAYETLFAFHLRIVAAQSTSEYF